MCEPAADVRPAVTDQVFEVTASESKNPSTKDFQQPSDATSTASPSTSYDGQLATASLRAPASRNARNNNQQLIEALLTVAVRQLVSEGASALGTLTGVVEKGSRWMSGLPQGFPPGTPTDTRVAEHAQ